MPLPTGIILLWHGAIVDIPAGWRLCDGTGGTPDLRDKFIVGAGSGYNPDDTGGANTHVHSFESDGHFHTLFAGFDLYAGNAYDKISDTRTVTGTTDTGSSLPPYYALAYIMKT